MKDAYQVMRQLLKWPIRLGLLMLVPMVALVVAVVLARSRTATPPLVVADSGSQLGTMVPGGLEHFSVSVTNTAGRRIAVKEIRRMCNCLKVRPSQFMILPGQKVEVAGTVRAPKRDGGFAVRCIFVGNDPCEVVGEFTLQGNVAESPFSVSQRPVYWGEITPGEEYGTRHVTVECFFSDAEPTFASDIEWLRAEAVRQAQSSKWLVMLTLNGGLRTGRNTGNVIVALASCELGTRNKGRVRSYREQIPVVVDLLPEVVVFPKTVTLGGLHGECAPVTGSVVVKSNGRTFTVTSVSANKHNQVSVECSQVSPREATLLIRRNDHTTMVQNAAVHVNVVFADGTKKRVTVNVIVLPLNSNLSFEEDRQS